MIKQLNKYLLTKYKDPNDYRIINKNIYSKTAISMQTINEINKMCSVIAVFALTENSYPYQKGYRLGLCLT